MQIQRFHKIVPEARADDFTIRARYHARIDLPWEVVYDGRVVTSGDVFTCTRWVAAFRRHFG